MKKSKILSAVLIISMLISAMSVFSLGISAAEFTESPEPKLCMSTFVNSQITIDGEVGDDEKYTDAIDMDLWIGGVAPDYAVSGKKYSYKDVAPASGWTAPLVRFANDGENVYIYVEALRFFNDTNKVQSGEEKSGMLYLQIGFNGKNGTNNTNGEWVSLAIVTGTSTEESKIYSAAVVGDTEVTYTEYADTDAMNKAAYKVIHNGDSISANQGGSVEAKIPIPDAVKSQLATNGEVEVDFSVFLNNNKGETIKGGGRSASGFGFRGGFAYDGTDVGARLTLTTEVTVEEGGQDEEIKVPDTLSSTYLNSAITIDGMIGSDEVYAEKYELLRWVNGVNPDQGYKVDAEVAVPSDPLMYYLPYVRFANDSDYIYVYVEGSRLFTGTYGTDSTNGGYIYLQFGFEGEDGVYSPGNWVSLAVATDCYKQGGLYSSAVVDKSGVQYTSYSDTDPMSSTTYAIKYYIQNKTKGSVEAKFPIPDAVKSQLATNGEVEVDFSIFLQNNKAADCKNNSGMGNGGFTLNGGFAYDGSEMGAKLTLTTTSGVIPDNDQNNENNNANTPTDTDGETSSTEKSETTEVSNTEKDTSASTSDEQKGGCGSSVASVGVVLLAACACGCSIIPKRKTAKNKGKNYEEI
ncbi:MAG: hypothetical protein IKJ00_03190 [Clostridia bacterium]|nr:hypothetical protein [Clostridia bacterium]